MPKFSCKCGNVLNLSDVWPECEWRLVPMSCLGEVADDLDEGKVPTGDVFYDLIEKMSVTVYRCAVCSRLHLEVAKNRFESYVREDESR